MAGREAAREDMAALQVLTFGGRAQQQHWPRDVGHAERQELNSSRVTHLLADIGGRVQAAQQTFGAVAENHSAYSLDPQRKVREADMFSRLLTGIGTQAQAALHISGTSDNVTSLLGDICGRALAAREAFWGAASAGIFYRDRGAWSQNCIAVADLLAGIGAQVRAA